MRWDEKESGPKNSGLHVSFASSLQYVIKNVSL